MTQEIIEMARESGMDLYGLGKDRYRFVHHLEAFAKLVEDKVTAREREACAMQLDASANQIRSRLGGLTDEDHVCIGVLVYEAKQIRARGES